MFTSQVQRKMMYAKKPKLAKEFESKTPHDMKLPEEVKKQRSSKLAAIQRLIKKG